MYMYLLTEVRFYSGILFYFPDFANNLIKVVKDALHFVQSLHYMTML